MRCNEHSRRLNRENDAITLINAPLQRGAKPQRDASPSPPLEERAGERRSSPPVSAAFNSTTGNNLRRPGMKASTIPPAQSRTPPKREAPLSLAHLLDPEVLGNPYPLYHRLHEESP